MELTLLTTVAFNINAVVFLFAFCSFYFTHVQFWVVSQPLSVNCWTWPLKCPVLISSLTVVLEWNIFWKCSQSPQRPRRLPIATTLKKNTWKGCHFVILWQTGAEIKKCIQTSNGQPPVVPISSFNSAAVMCVSWLRAPLRGTKIPNSL